LTFNQALDDVRSDTFPVTVEEGCQLAALRAQVEFGDITEGVQYSDIIDKYMPKYMKMAIDPEDVAAWSVTWHDVAWHAAIVAVTFAPAPASVFTSALLLGSGWFANN
jgi:hypothetical protein